VKRSLESQVIAEYPEELDRPNRFYGNIDQDKSKNANRLLRRQLSYYLGQHDNLQSLLKSSQGRLSLAESNLKTREQQWNDEKYWLNHSLTSKGQECLQLEADFKDLERRNQEIQLANQDLEKRMEALNQLNQELTANMEKQKREFDDQLQFYESVMCSSNDAYWQNKREMLEQEMNRKTADIQDENLKLKSKNADLLLDLRSKTEELNKVNKKWQDKC
jgi:hypothetical protein